jgi:hypothetical protein
MIATPTPLKQRDIALFFFPLLLNVQFMSVSHSIINAALARQQDYIVALAAFSVAMVLHLFLASPSYQNHTITIAMVRGAQSLRSVLIFAALVATYVSIMLALVAFTPVGDFVLGRILGVSGAIADQARDVLAILVFLPFVTGLRGVAQGLVIQARRTSLVSFATGVRIGALLAVLLLCHRWWDGARLGAIGLLTCVSVETLVISLCALQVRVRHAGGVERTPGEVLRYAFPLAYSSCLQQTIPLLINAIISRLPEAPLALAAFGIIRGFLFLLAGPMRNLQQATMTLVATAADHVVLITFFRRVAAGMALIMLLIALPPLNGLILGQVMGLDTAMRSYIAWPLVLCMLYPALYGAANLLRGRFASTHRTASLGVSTIIKTFYMLLCWAILVPLAPPIPGVFVAVGLLLSAEALEVLYLRRQLRRLNLGYTTTP